MESFSAITEKTLGIDSDPGTFYVLKDKWKNSSFLDSNYSNNGRIQYTGANFEEENIKQTTAPFSKVNKSSNFSNLEQNMWFIFNDKYLRHRLGWTITLVIAYTVVFIMGVVGNLMVIVVVLKRPPMRNVTNMFLMNLAVADMFVIVFCVPATLVSNVFTPWILGWVMCKGVAYIQGVSVCASAYSLAAVSFERYRAICCYLECPRGLTKRQAWIIIWLIWTVASVLTIPWAVIFNVAFSREYGISYCIETWEDELQGKIYFLVGNLFFCYSFPLILICISNIVVWRYVSKRKVPQEIDAAGIIERVHQRTRQGVRKMLGIVTLAFLLGWLPLYILVTIAKFVENVSAHESETVKILMPFAQWLGSMNSCINPVLYAFLNRKFRKMFVSLLPSCMKNIFSTN